VSRIAGSSAEVAIGDLRRRYVPIVTTLIAAALSGLLPIVATVPLIPDVGFMVLIAWRLLRPEVFSAQAALGLGLVNDLLSGHPLGQSMALWTLTFLAFDFLDARSGFRDYWIDWLFAAAAIIFHTFGGWYVAALMGSITHFMVMVPQILLSILFYPVVARLVLALDRRRLSR
jgi:rod shape-determining protein MreD